MEKPYFIYVGNAYPHKNLARAIEAAVGCDVNFAIVSSRGVFAERLKKLITKFNAEKFVKLLGFVPDEELKTLYKNAEGFIFPSLYEGFGLPGLEAMSAGTVVLASDIPVFKEIYKDKVLYFNPYDYTSIERSMREVLSMDIEEREKTIKEGQKFVKNYSWAKMAKQTLKVYEEVIKKYKE
ncbi:MAG: glycosyltransferase family 1 protein [Patescibacteria group bacterium]